MTETIPDQAARDAACDPARSVLVRAPAGSGKTGVLLLRYLRCLLTVDAPEQVVAITFTKKAAAEIRERVLQALMLAAERAESGEPASDDYERRTIKIANEVLQRDRQLDWQLLHNPRRLRVATFDSFCSSLARKLPLLSGLGQIQTSDDQDALYRDAILALFRSLEKRDTPPELRRALGNVLDYANNRIEQLTPLLANLLAKRDQWVEGIVGADLAAVEQALRHHIEEQFALLVRQLRAGGLDSAVAALAELSSHSEALAWAADLRPLEQSTLEQQACLTQLADLLLTRDGSLISPRTAGPKKGFIKDHGATAQIKAWLEAHRETAEGERLAAVLDSLRKLPGPQLPEQARGLIGDLMQVLLYLLAELRLVFEREGRVDFGEVAFRAIQALHPLEEGEGVYSDVLLREDRIQHVLVDEMQDTSVNQMHLLRNLMQGWQPGDGRSLFLCGDLQQSIYLFRGALVGLFGELIEAGDFHGHPLEQLQLQANFRSAPAVVNWVNGSFQNLLADNFVRAEPMRDLDGSVQVHPFVSDDKNAAALAEAERVVAIVQQAQSERPDASIAVLVRSRSHLRQIMKALKAAGIAFAGQDIDKLQESLAVVDLLALLRAWWHPADRAAWVGVLRAAFVGLGWDDIWCLCQRADSQDVLLSELLLAGDDRDLSEEGRQRLQRLRGAWQSVAREDRAVDIRWALPALWYSLGGPLTIAEHQRADIDRVLAVLDDCAPGGYVQDISTFERALERLYAQPPRARLELMTIHKSKGLEFDVVIVPGLGSGTRSGDSELFYWRRSDNALLLAPRPASGADDEATERLYRYLQGQRSDDEKREVDRLLYVALTRAKRHLHLLGTVKEDRSGELKPTANSLLAKLWPVVGTEFERADPVEAAATGSERRVPVAPRLVLDSRIHIAPCLLQKAVAEAPLDRLAEQAKQAVLEDNIEDRAVGIVYHELMRRLGNGYRQILEPRPALERAVLARLRHYCHPEQGLDDSLRRVLRLLDNTLSCASGQWILQHYEQSGAEQAIRRRLGDSWQKLIIDRFFVDGDSCWIVDYKTAEGRGEAFYTAQRERYREKMEAYRRAIIDTGVAEQVRVALYFPAGQHLEAW